MKLLIYYPIMEKERKSKPKSDNKPNPKNKSIGESKIKTQMVRNERDGRKE